MIMMIPNVYIFENNVSQFHIVLEASFETSPQQQLATTILAIEKYTIRLE